MRNEEERILCKLHTELRPEKEAGTCVPKSMGLREERILSIRETTSRQENAGPMEVALPIFLLNNSLLNKIIWEFH